MLENSDSIIIEGWAEKVCNKTTFITEGKLYGHLNKSGYVRIVNIDELDTPVDNMKLMVLLRVTLS